MWSLDSGVTRLAKHEVKANGSGMMAEEKRAIAYLVFALSEGLRFTNVENDIAQTIANGGELLVNGYGGDLVNKWETLSLAGDHRIAMAHTRPAE